jgi:hypothetical protein
MQGADGRARGREGADGGWSCEAEVRREKALALESLKNRSPAKRRASAPGREGMSNAPGAPQQNLLHGAPRNYTRAVSPTPPTCLQKRALPSRLQEAPTKRRLPNPLPRPLRAASSRVSAPSDAR